MTQLALAMKLDSLGIDAAAVEEFFRALAQRGDAVEGRRAVAAFGALLGGPVPADLFFETPEEKLDAAYRRLDAARTADRLDRTRVAAALEEVRALQAIEVENMQVANRGANALSLDDVANSIEEARRLLEHD